MHSETLKYAHFSSVTPAWTGINWHVYSVSFAGMFNAALFYRQTSDARYSLAAPLAPR